MLQRIAHALFTAAIVAGASCVAPESAGAQDWKAPRTVHGHPDLQGTWTNATITPLERPKEFGERLVITEAEAKAIESQNEAFSAESNAPTPPGTRTEDLPESCGLGFKGADCGYNFFWIDRGSQVVTMNGERRSSLIVDPPNGKVPALLPERQKVVMQRYAMMRTNFDGPEARPAGERCLLSFSSSSGPPMLPVLYNNHYQIVQNKDTVMILVEMVHDARVIRLNGKPLPKGVRKWMGDSIGRWEGDTLVVETSNFTEHEMFRGATPDMKVTERFTRVGPDKIHYRFTVEDPAAFTKPWSAEYPFHLTDQPIYEYACHEGNYALPGILAGARKDEETAAAPAARE